MKTLEGLVDHLAAIPALVSTAPAWNSEVAVAVMTQAGGPRGDSFSEAVRRGLAVLDFLGKEVARWNRLTVIESGGGSGLTLRESERRFVHSPARPSQTTGSRERGRFFRRIRRSQPHQKENTDAHQH